MNLIIRFVIYILLFYVNIICYSYDCNKFNFFIKRNNYEKMNNFATQYLL